MKAYIHLCSINFYVGLVNHHEFNFYYKIFLGWRKRTEEEIHEERDAVMRSEYFDPIEHFPDRIDQLLDAINRVYLSFIRFFISWFF
jgi:hypothetical protein